MTGTARKIELDGFLVFYYRLGFEKPTVGGTAADDPVALVTLGSWGWVGRRCPPLTFELGGQGIH